VFFTQTIEMVEGVVAPRADEEVPRGGRCETLLEAMRSVAVLPGSTAGTRAEGAGVLPRNLFRRRRKRTTLRSSSPLAGLPRNRGKLPLVSFALDRARTRESSGSRGAVV